MRIARALPAYALIAFLGGCVTKEKGCTVMGCNSLVEVSFHASHPAYSAAFFFDSLPDTLHASCTPTHGELSDSASTRVYFDCGDSLFSFASFYGNGKPAKVYVRLADGDGKVFLDTTANLVWGSDFYPNGKDCDPVPCQSAQVDVPAAKD